MNLREAAEHLLDVWDNGTYSVIEALEILRIALAEPDGWRQCAVGQRTTQYCGLLEEAVKAEREACAKFLDAGVDMAGLAGDPVLTKYTFELLTGCAAAIRARGDNDHAA